jgi:hypothetical protein
LIHDFLNNRFSGDIFRDGTLSAIAYNVVAYCRSCCIPTLYQREPARENTQNLIPRGKAAILAICSLNAVAAFSQYFPTTVFMILLWNSKHTFNS